MKKALVRQVLSMAQCCGKGDSGILIIAIKKKGHKPYPSFPFQTGESRQQVKRATWTVQTWHFGDRVSPVWITWWWPSRGTPAGPRGPRRGAGSRASGRPGRSRRRAGCGGACRPRRGAAAAPSPTGLLQLQLQLQLSTHLNAKAYAATLIKLMTSWQRHSWGQRQFRRFLLRLFALCTVGHCWGCDEVHYLLDPRQ